MSMVINLVEDHNIYLCEGGPVYNGSAPPTPITYLTQWKIVGNSEVHGNEIWSCGEYSAVDGKYHILVQPLGGSIADIALTEPLRKVNDVADSIEFANGVAMLTRMLKSFDMGDCEWSSLLNNDRTTYRYRTNSITDMDCPSSVKKGLLLSAKYDTLDIGSLATPNEGIGCYLSSGAPRFFCYDIIAGTVNDSVAFREYVKGVEVIYKLVTPTTELVDAPQIEEADSYSCVISQGGKAVSWSSFETE